MTNLSEIKKQKIKQKRKNKIKTVLETDSKNQETINVKLEIPIYEEIEEVPNLEKGDVVYVKNLGQLMIEDGT